MKVFPPSFHYVLGIYTFVIHFNKIIAVHKIDGNISPVLNLPEKCIIPFFINISVIISYLL